MLLFYLYLSSQTRCEAARWQTGRGLVCAQAVAILHHAPRCMQCPRVAAAALNKCTNTGCLSLSAFSCLNTAARRVALCVTTMKRHALHRWIKQSLEKFWLTEAQIALKISFQGVAAQQALTIASRDFLKREKDIFRAW